MAIESMDQEQFKALLNGGALPPIEEPSRSMDEKTWMWRVINEAIALGYLVYHTHNSQRSNPGFPDLVICGHGRLFFVELKTEKGKLSGDQETWIGRLLEAGQQAFVWRPSQWQEVLRVLKGEKT